MYNRHSTDVTFLAPDYCRFPQARHKKSKTILKISFTKRVCVHVEVCTAPGKTLLGVLWTIKLRRPPYKMVA